MKTKLIVIWVGVFLLVGMCLYPPWISKRHHEVPSSTGSAWYNIELDRLFRKIQT